jgi:large subunit ribosomal protein L21
MYAIIRDGGRQYRVQEGQEIEIDFRQKASPGDQIKFGDVLAAGDGDKLKYGAPLLSGASITAEVIGAVHGPKLTVQKFRRRKTFRRKTGHRQLFTRVRIGQISI